MKGKYLIYISAIFVTVLIVSNIVSAKIVSVNGFVFDGGTLLFPLSYIFGDVLTEVYGYKNSRKVIWLGFACTALACATIMLVGVLPAASDWHNQSAYDAILGLTPRIVLASLIAFLAGEFANSYVLAKLKVKMSGKYLWVRTIGSTLVGELLDSAIFISIAFVGVFEIRTIISLIIFNYIFKTLVEIAFTPITYKVVNFLKKQEKEDCYDINTDFNPFSLQD